MDTIHDNDTAPTVVTARETVAEMAGRMEHRRLGSLRPRRSRNWLWAALVVAAAAWGFAGCAAPTAQVQVEAVGTLSAGPSVRSAPLAHDAPPELGFVAGSDDAAPGEVVTTETRGDASAAAASDASTDAAPEVVGKQSGLLLGGSR